MNGKKFLSIAIAWIAILICTGQKINAVKIKPFLSHYIEVSEPSDLVYYPENNSFFIVSDNGELYETSLNGKILRKAPIDGVDFEAITLVDNYLYVVEERHRNVLKIDPKSLEVVQTIYIPYAGGRNKSFESIAYIPDMEKFILITEKDPIIIMEFDQNFNKINMTRFTGARDISSATYHLGYLYFLSDEDRTIFKIKPTNYDILKAWKIPVINPEGIVVMPDHTFRILSDDREKMYYFKNPD
ncbi:SdiA-regulated domain-containing protein [Schleiferia thermophila]|jgi:uncharacterized protein YjiK|uniref:SdiA-regulated protein n=1 Tax=Schleiferia thermophila TaxID=884107 RepID=A0A369A621_9FLAO|nr:SdiA-regulated domain-containing protein [Schleiferia thermophila]KFD38401.1 hypothetical protein AT05_10550 [Schleiferia thermophila str. Yellowstone]RCX04790.1 SdiA-regulated protein [Schleiferia thermophila]GCD79681.1 hypothetical protein JCM30197_09280 [Schleiferia thermophila]